MSNLRRVSDASGNLLFAEVNSAPIGAVDAFSELWEDVEAVVLRVADGSVLVPPVRRWLEEPSADEAEMLDRCIAPVLDVGCGPGRHVAALGERGKLAIGIDTSKHALAVARRRGASVMARSVFDQLPRTGSWGSVLLADGNVGIGGNPSLLLGRTSQLLMHGGRVILELEPPGGRSGRTVGRLEWADRKGSWFPWAFVTVDELADLGRPHGLVPTCTWQVSGRWFACLDKLRGREQCREPAEVA